MENLRISSKANSFDFLRLLFAVCVLLAHTYALSGSGSDPIGKILLEQDNAGGLAVAGFFIISGYLITQSYYNLSSPVKFLWHRFLRIYPAFWICLLITAFVFAPAVYLISQGSLQGFLECSPSSFNYILSNFPIKIQQHNICGLLDKNPLPLAFNGSLWTLYDEVRCYLAVCLLGMIGAVNSKKYIYAGIAVFVFVIYAVSLNLPAVNDLPILGGSLLRHLSLFLIGGLFFLFADVVPNNKWLVLVCVALIAFSLNIKGAYPAISVLAWPYLIIWLAKNLPLRDWARRGDYSYGLYIYAFPVQQIFALVGAYRYGIMFYFFISLFGALALAFLSCHLIERPALRLKKRVCGRPN